MLTNQFHPSHFNQPFVSNQVVQLLDPDPLDNGRSSRSKVNTLISKSDEWNDGRLISTIIEDMELV